LIQRQRYFSRYYDDIDGKEALLRIPIFVAE